ncbi:MAG: signal transduction histidine kinase [Polyangiales bacterium]|jgi:signal transduction histidine kinase
MRILIDTSQALAARLRITLQKHDLTTERSLQHLDVACLDGDPSRAIEFARTRPDTAVLFFGEYFNVTEMLDAGVVDVVPIDKHLETRLRILLTRLERDSAAFEKRLMDLFIGAPDGVTITTDHTITYANRAFAEMLLDGGRDFVGRSCGSLAHPDDTDRIHEQSDECICARAPSDVVEFRLLRSDGSALSVKSWALPLTFFGRAAVLRFVRPQPLEREFDDQMVLADRMASVGTLAAGVAHELNNPLAYVLANLQMMRESLGRHNAPEFLEEVDTAIEGAHRMADIVRDLKTFAREPTTATDVVDVVSSLRSALQMCENEVRHRGTLELTVDTSPSVEINASRLVQVFVNLLINAAQAIEGMDGGVVRVSVGTDSRGWACVTIEDNGPGIAPADMRRIFEPFFTTKSAIEGTGLGLSICRNLVTQAHGELHVESVPGSGAKFTVYLPPTALQRRPKKLSSRPPAGSHADILVIDDEGLIGRALKRALSQHQVTVITDGVDALQLLARQKFDLIFCDLMMPGLSGMDVYRQAVAQDVSLKNRFVFMTGGAFTAGAQAFITETSSRVMEKPFNLKQVRTIAAEFVSLG